MAFQLDTSVFQMNRPADPIGSLAQGIGLGEGFRELRAKRKLRTRNEKYKDTLGELYRSSGGDLDKISIGLGTKGYVKEAMEMKQKSAEQKKAIAEQQAKALAMQKTKMAMGGAIANSYLEKDNAFKLDQFGNLKRAFQKNLGEVPRWLDNKDSYDQEVDGYLQMLKSSAGVGQKQQFSPEIVYGPNGEILQASREPGNLNLQQYKMPAGEGATKYQPPRLIAKDLGDRIEYVDPNTKTVVRTVYKDVPPEQTPEHKADVAGAEQEATEKGKAWEKVNNAVATEYGDWVANGKFSQATKGITQAENVIKALRSGRNMTGLTTAMTPDWIRAGINPESIDIQEQLQQLVQLDLKPSLGAQFTEKEGTQLIKRAYNPALKEEINAERVSRMLYAMKSALEAKVEAMTYFEENQTMKGFKSKALWRSINRLKNMNFDSPVKRSSTKSEAIKGGKKSKLSKEEEDAVNRIFK